MLTALLLYAALVVLLLTLQALTFVWNLYYWKARELALPPPAVSLSVLIPARNERHNLPRLLTALRAQEYAPREIIVCDDHSDDGTTEWLQAEAEPLGVQWFRGAEKPEGWIGKTWACHQLGARAQGDWLLFLDADLAPEPHFLGYLAAAMTDTPAQMVTAFPRLCPSGLVDALLEGMVGFWVFCAMPLQWVEAPGRPRFAFANGQVIGFRRSDYRRLEPHRAVRGSIVDDVDLARQTKQRGQRVLVLDGTRHFAVHMYRSGREAVDGFSKNAVSGAGGRGAALVVMVSMVVVWLGPLVLAAQGQGWAVAAAGLTALLFGLNCALGGLPAGYGLLYPLAVVLMEYVLARSLWWHWRGAVRWKGRSYRL